MLASAATALALLIAGCREPAVAKLPETKGQTGIASWYGIPFDGRPTASGEIFDMRKLTAAHRTLPLGTVAEITDLQNGKKVQVRINDRGPFVKDRIIDLSQAAGQTIDMPGMANVSIAILSTPVSRDLAVYAVQVGSFSSQKEAEVVRTNAANTFGNARVIFRPRDHTWRILIGEETSIDGGDALVKKVEPTLGESYVVRVDQDQ